MNTLIKLNKKIAFIEVDKNANDFFIDTKNELSYWALKGFQDDWIDVQLDDKYQIQKEIELENTKLIFLERIK